MRRDGWGYTFVVAAVLCVVCSVLVSGFAVALRPWQEANKKLDQQKNVLIAAGMDVDAMDSDEIQGVFDDGTVVRLLIDLETGEPLGEDVEVDAETYSQRDAANSSDLSTPIEPADALGGIKQREKYAFVYKVKNEAGVVDQVVLPVYGKGLWSTLYGFLAIDSDGETVRGITFYEHKETPGLGGEVDNPNWKALWPGKKLTGDDGEVLLQVIKGGVTENTSDPEYKIDGLTGATITCNGVSEMVKYWGGENGYQPFLARFRESTGGGSDG
ncbi:MAG: Na(+)-translocating NADH-quinone reductase subunit C [Planctomycetota bacterium]